MGERTRVLVIGLDGATWNIIKPLVREGKLPTIARLMKNGCHGDLESSIPHYTFPAWKCYSTGKNPGKLGAYDYWGVDIAKGRFFLNNSTSFRGKELWDYLGENNLTCGVIDMPTTYPCKPINGVMISHGAPRPYGYTYPEDLEKELKNRFNYKIDPDYLFELGKDAAITSIKEVIKQRFDVAHYLLKEYDPSFLHVTIFNIDTIQHHYWRDMEEGDAKYGKVVEDFWILIDDGITSLLNEFRDGASYIILMSDHGFAAQKGEFRFMKWLSEKDLVKIKKPNPLLSGLLFGLGLTRGNVLSLVGRTRIVPLLRRQIPKRIQRRIVEIFPAMIGVAHMNIWSSAMDWGKSKVIPLPTGPLYINTDYFTSQEEYEKFREALISKIKEIEDPKTGEKFAREVYKGEEVYFGKYMHRAPDLVILHNQGYTSAGSIRGRELWNYPTRGWTGVHDLQGIFLACGQGIKKGVEMEGATIYDLAPTILHIFGTPVPSDMDGRVLTGIFEGGSALAKREIEYGEADERMRVKERVKELKALDRI